MAESARLLSIKHAVTNLKPEQPRATLGANSEPANATASLLKDGNTHAAHSRNVSDPKAVKF